VRQFLLVIVLVAAAFLGGAFVNGPGLQWVQTKLLRSLGLNHGGEITSVDLRSVPGSQTSTDEAGLIKPERDVTEGPVAPTPSVVTENKSPQHDASDRPAIGKTKPKSNPDGSGSPRSESLASSPPIKQTPPLPDSPALEPPASDPEVAPASTASSSPPSHPDSNVAPAILDTLAALLPSSPPSSDPSPPSSPSPLPQPVTSARKLAADGNEDWVILERKLQSLGVSRYTMEGEPGGRVVFSCLIPLAGRQAVSQRFEAEGDDLVQAARATLRRIALWRATQPSSQ
jgi:hypothetical protein